MKTTLPSLKIAEETKSNMQLSIKKYNDNPANNLTLNQADFRRLAYELLSQSILQNKPILVKLRL